MEQSDKIEFARNALMAALGVLSKQSNVHILRNEFDDIDLNNANRLLMIRNGRRLFAVDLNRDSDRGHDAFISQTGEAYDVEMLTLFVPYEDVKYDGVWNLYVDWIVKGLSESEISDGIVEFDDGNYGVA